MAEPAVVLPAQCATAAATPLREALVAAAAGGPETLVVDAGEVESIGQAVLQILLAGHADAARDDRKFRITNASPAFAARVGALGLADRIGLTAEEGK